jgi:hypothetical protein
MELDGVFLYRPCRSRCQLEKMHIVADCKCKTGRPEKYDEWVSVSEQIELFDSETRCITNGCMTDEGLVIYNCDLSKMNCA